MRFEKIVASFLTVLTLVSTVAFAVDLGDYPSFLMEDHSANYYVVVGAAAQPGDVVGAVDLATRLAGESYKLTSVSGTTGGFTGLDRDGINIGTSSGGAALNSGGTIYSNAFPANTLRNSHYSGLKDSTITWKSNSYDYREDVDVAGVRMRHDFGTSNINGTEKMVVQSGNVVYKYVFEKALNLSTATTAGTTGTISNPEYTYPVAIKLLGRDFTIVGVGTSSVKMLVGSSGTATATTPVTYGDYEAYSDLGSNGSWARVLIKDKSGNTVDTLVINNGDSKDSSATSLSVKVTSVRALQDGTVVGSDLVVGPLNTVEKEYDTSADVTSTGTANDRFPGETEWGIQTSGFSTSGYIPANAEIQVVYKPSSVLYLKPGEKVVLPNNYGELGFVGFGTENFATYTIKPVTGLSAYNYSSDTQSFGNLNGLEITTDKSSSIVSKGSNTFDKAYVLFNYTVGGANPYPVFVGFYDNAKQKILINGTISNINGTNVVTAEYYSAYMNSTSSFRYDFKLTYGGAGERDYWLNVTVNPATTTVFSSVRAGASGSENVYMGFQNKTAWTTSQAPEFRLGSTASASESYEVNVTTEGTAYSITSAVQDVVDDSGVQVLNPNNNAANDRVVLKVPSKELTARVYFGKQTSETPSGTVKEVVPVTNAVAKLDTEVDPATVGRHLVLVGGPAVNRLTAQALGLTYPTYGSSGLLPFSEGEGYIALKQDVFKTGQNVVVVAGWEAQETRNAALVLQQYSSFLTQLDGNLAVKVTSVSASGITAA